MSFKLILIVSDSLFNFFIRFQIIHESYDMTFQQVVFVMIHEFFEENLLYDLV